MPNRQIIYGCSKDRWFDGENDQPYRHSNRGKLIAEGVTDEAFSNELKAPGVYPARGVGYSQT